MKISTTKRYIEDVKKFKTRIQHIADKKSQVYYQKLLDEMQFKVKVIDDVHSSTNPGKIQPVIIKEHLKELSEIRYQLEHMKV